MANEGRGQCRSMMNFNRRCIGAEGHDGPCSGGVKSPRLGAYECGFCHATFPSLAEFDAFPLLESIGDAIVIGPTGNNVRDLRILLAY